MNATKGAIVMANIKMYALFISAVALHAGSSKAQSAPDENISPAPSGREETDTTVYPDGITISMPGKDNETPSTNPVDWSNWQPGHDDDTTVTFDPGVSGTTTTSDPPAEPTAPAPEPEPDPEL